MTDSWARPSADGARARRPPAPTVEIELDGPDVDAADGGTGGDEPNWRFLAGAAAVLGVVLGLVVAGVMLWSDDDGADEPPTTTAPADELASEITTPPTLPPVDTVPSPGIADASRQTPVRMIEVPEYPLADEGDTAGWPTEPDGAAVFDTLDRSLRVVVTVDNVTTEAPLTSEIIWDAVNRRYRITSPSQDGTTTTIYDVASETIYRALVIDPAVVSWAQEPADSVTWGPGSIDALQYLEQALLGPVRHDNVGRALLVVPQEPIVTVDGVTARRTTYVMPDDEVGIWAGTGGEDVVSRWEVFTDVTGRVVRIQGINSLTGSPSLVVHSPSRSDVSIDLPAVENVGDVAFGDDRVRTTSATAESLRPIYGTLQPNPAPSTGPYSIADAVARLVDHPPAAAAVEVWSTDGLTRFTAQRDDGNDRRLMTVGYDTSSMTVQIDDGASATTLLTDDVDGNWTRLSNTGPGGRRAPIDERLISGTVSGSAIEAAEVVAPYRFVALSDGTTALEAHLVLEPGSTVLTSVLPMSLDPDRPVHTYLYVSDGVIREIHVLSNRSARLLVQRFDHDAEPEITLPDDERIFEG